jgi:geranylgeranyl transferase type-1 subunit beta
MPASGRIVRIADLPSRFLYRQSSLSLPYLFSFSPLRIEMSAEDDVRMVLCACVISDLLQDWSGVDVGRATAFVQDCLVSHDAFVGRIVKASNFHLLLSPCRRTKAATVSVPVKKRKVRSPYYPLFFCACVLHLIFPFSLYLLPGGTTYCALVSLQLLSTASASGSSSSTKPISPPATSRKTISWCLHRQIPISTAFPGRGGGFQGRTGKKGDACYSFWVGAALCVSPAARDMLGLGPS